MSLRENQTSSFPFYCLCPGGWRHLVHLPPGMFQCREKHPPVQEAAGANTVHPARGICALGQTRLS